MNDGEDKKTICEHVAVSADIVRMDLKQTIKFAISPNLLSVAWGAIRRLLRLESGSSITTKPGKEALALIN